MPPLWRCDRLLRAARHGRARAGAHDLGGSRAATQRSAGRAIPPGLLRRGAQR